MKSKPQAKNNIMLLGSKGSGKSFRTKHLIKISEVPCWIVDPLNEYSEFAPKTVNKIGRGKEAADRLSHLQVKTHHRTTTLDPASIYYFCHEAYKRGEFIVIDEFHSVLEAFTDSKESITWMKKFDHDYRTARHKGTVYYIATQRWVGMGKASMSKYAELMDQFYIFRGTGRSWKDCCQDYAGLNKELIELLRKAPVGTGFMFERGWVSPIKAL